MSSKNHIHQYIRSIGARTTKANKDSGFINYYKCALPDCTHYVRVELILGKESICNRCGGKFTLPNNMRMLKAVPHCKACTKSYKKPARKLTPEELVDVLN